MKFLSVFVAFFAAAQSLTPPTESASHQIPDVALHHYRTQLFNPTPAPRLVMYVQTFTTKDNKPLSLLPLLEQQTRVTNVILASVHLHETPGEIRLNDDPFDAEKFDQVWKEVKILQEAGIKVSMLLGGAAKGTYKNLNGTDTEVRNFPSSNVSFEELLIVRVVIVLRILPPSLEINPQILPRRSRHRHRGRRSHFRPPPSPQCTLPRSRSLLPPHNDTNLLRAPPTRNRTSKSLRLQLFRTRQISHRAREGRQISKMVQCDVLWPFRTWSTAL